MFRHTRQHPARAAVVLLAGVVLSLALTGCKKSPNPKQASSGVALPAVPADIAEFSKDDTEIPKVYVSVEGAFAVAFPGDVSRFTDAVGEATVITFHWPGGTGFYLVVASPKEMTPAEYAKAVSRYFPAGTEGEVLTLKRVEANGQTGTETALQIQGFLGRSPTFLRIRSFNVRGRTLLAVCSSDRSKEFVLGENADRFMASFMPHGGKRSNPPAALFLGKDALTLKGHASDVSRLTFSPDGKRLASSGDGAAVNVWDATSGKERFALPEKETGPYNLVFSPDGKRLAGRWGQVVQVWDSETGKELLALKGHAKTVTVVAISPDGRRYAAGCVDGTTKMWDADTGKEILTYEGHGDAVTWVAFSPDGKRLATTSIDKTAKIWDATTGRELLVLQADKADVGAAVAFSPGRKWLATAGDAVRVWDAGTGALRATLTSGNVLVRDVMFSPDGKRLASVVWSSAYSTVNLWDLTPESKSHLVILGLHSGDVRCLAFSPDGKRLATGSKDIKIWKLSK